jgi:hypothetical protein
MADGNSNVQAQIIGHVQGINQNLAKLVKGFGSINTTQALASPGYMKFSNGLVLNFGTGSTSSGTGSVTFALPFPTACLNVMLTVSGSATATDNALIASSAPTKTGANVYGNASQSLNFYYLAIGY